MPVADRLRHFTVNTVCASVREILPEKMSPVFFIKPLPARNKKNIIKAAETAI